MDKERLFEVPESYSEKKSDLAVDNPVGNDPIKAGNVFDPKNKKKKSKNDLLTENK